MQRCLPPPHAVKWPDVWPALLGRFPEGGNGWVSSAEVRSSNIMFARAVKQADGLEFPRLHRIVADRVSGRDSAHCPANFDNICLAKVEVGTYASGTYNVPSVERSRAKFEVEERALALLHKGRRECGWLCRCATEVPVWEGGGLGCGPCFYSEVNLLVQRRLGAPAATGLAWAEWITRQPPRLGVLHRSLLGRP
jgi:hypothetical protein